MHIKLLNRKVHLLFYNPPKFFKEYLPIINIPISRIIGSYLLFLIIYTTLWVVLGKYHIRYQRLEIFIFIPGAYLGTTIKCTLRVYILYIMLEKIHHPIKFSRLVLIDLYSIIVSYAAIIPASILANRSLKPVFYLTHFLWYFILLAIGINSCTKLRIIRILLLELVLMGYLVMIYFAFINFI